MRTKQTARGSKAQCPKGMTAATFSSGADVDPEQQQEVTGMTLRTARTGRTWKKPLIESQVQVSAKVRQVTNPSRLKEEHRHLPKKFRQNHSPVT